MPMEEDYVTTLSLEILEQAKNELGEDEHLRNQSLMILREWAKKQPHLSAMPTGNYSFVIRLDRRKQDLNFDCCGTTCSRQNLIYLSRFFSFFQMPNSF